LTILVGSWLTILWHAARSGLEAAASAGPTSAVAMMTAVKAATSARMIFSCCLVVDAPTVMKPGSTQRQGIVKGILPADEDLR